MLTVISPAKKLDERPRALADGALTSPDFATEAMALVSAARQLSVADLQARLDKHVAAFAKALAFDLKARKLVCDRPPSLTVPFAAAFVAPI